MTLHPNEDVIEVLACVLAKRPAGAPTFADLAPALRVMRRDSDTLVVEYEQDAAARLTDLVAAERLCCAGIDWRADGARLIVRATPPQLDALEAVLAR